jgi:hypothetical protein
VWCTHSSRRLYAEGRGHRRIGEPARRSACGAGRGEQREKESCSLDSVRSDRFPRRTARAEGGRRDADKGLGDGRGSQFR